jgi:ubiquinone/menaquinone biosynthesis C-methylase UbiE
VEQIPWLYDGLCRLMEGLGLGRWRRWLVAGAAGRVLEIGAGTGRNLPRYPPGTPVMAIEPSSEALAKARRRASGALLVRARAEALPFREGTFDTVVSSLVFCSVAEPTRGLAEVRRVLRRGGALRMLEHVRSRNALVGRVQDRLQPAWTWVSGGCHPNRETEKAVESCGFAIDPDSRRARGALRSFVARARS